MTEASHDQLASVVRQHAGQLAAALMMRAAASATRSPARSDAPGLRTGGHDATAESERVMWDALDAGDDPTDGSGSTPASEGR